MVRIIVLSISNADNLADGVPTIIPQILGYKHQ